MNALRWAALVLSVAAYPLYWQDVFTRGRPLNPVTWGVFLMVDGLILAAQIVNHHVAVPMPLYCLGMVITLYIAIRYGKREFDTIDLCVAGLAILSMIVWSQTDAVVAESLALFAVYVGTIPLWKELWHDPNTEPRWPWFLFFAGVVFELAGEGDPRGWKTVEVLPLFGFAVQQLSVLGLGLRRKPGRIIG